MDELWPTGKEVKNIVNKRRTDSEIGKFKIKDSDPEIKQTMKDKQNCHCQADLFT